MNEGLELAKQILDEAKGLVATPAESGDAARRQTRGGPLQVVGRLYLGLTMIGAVAATASGCLDSTRSITWSTWALRVLVVVAVHGGLAGGAYLLYFLAKRQPSLLYSPTEFAANVHAQIVEQGERQGTPKLPGRRREQVPGQAPAAPSTPVRENGDEPETLS